MRRVVGGSGTPRQQNGQQYRNGGSLALPLGEMRQSECLPISDVRQTDMFKANGIVGLKQLPETGEGKDVNVRRVTRSELMTILERQSFRCALSGIQLTPETACADHVRSLAEGGTDAADNCQVLDVQVNRAKGTMSSEEFVALCCEVADYCRRKSLSVVEAEAS